MTSQEHELDTLIRARYGILWIVSPEEARVEDAIRRAVEGSKSVLVWSATQPLDAAIMGDYRTRPGLDGISQAFDALDSILKRVQTGARAVFVLRDLDPYLDNPVLVRRLRDLSAALKKSYCTLIIISPVLHLPPHLEKEVSVVDFDLPGESELGELLDELAARMSEQPEITVDLADGGREVLTRAALGLTADEALNAWHRVLVERGGLSGDDAPLVAREKRQVARRSGALEFLETAPSWDDIGGLDGLKGWLRARRNGFSGRARDFGLPAPRGVLLLGVPGCGKSLTARAVGAFWGIPLLRLDVGSVFGKYVGESEANLRRALRAAERVAPCVLWVDEWEKAFSTRGDDGGTALRILGAFLSWLQEHTAPVFVVATANSVEGLPPELLRRGRFDEIFFVDLPDTAEREQIWNIHLRRRNRAPQAFDIEQLSGQSEGYSGAEIEGATIAALYDAFDANREVTTDDLSRALSQLVPLSRAMSDQIVRLREWADTRARGASHPATASTTASTAGKTVVDKAVG